MSLPDFFNKKPEPQVFQGPALKMEYMEFLLERMCWVSSPGKLDFPEFRKMLKEAFDARSK